MTRLEKIGLLLGCLASVATVWGVFRPDRSDREVPSGIASKPFAETNRASSAKPERRPETDVTNSETSRSEPSQVLQSEETQKNRQGILDPPEIFPQSLDKVRTKTVYAWPVLLNEGDSTTLCEDGIEFSFSVAKSGNRADSAIYVTRPFRSGRIEVNSRLELSQSCIVMLERTGRRSSFFAVFDRVKD